MASNKPKTTVAPQTVAEAEIRPVETVETVQRDNTPKAPAESVYAASELVANHKVFNASHEIVEIALRKAGKESATLSEAKTIIETFKRKEVK